MASAVIDFYVDLDDCASTLTLIERTMIPMETPPQRGRTSKSDQMRGTRSGVRCASLKITQSKRKHPWKYLQSFRESR